LTSVHIYNANNSGRIVPKSSHVDDATIKVLHPSLPDNVAKLTGRLDYFDFEKPGEPKIAMRGAIYVFETEAKNDGNLSEEICIVVGGLFNGDLTPTYYRLDFFHRDGSTHMDILRNFRYTCNIVGVTDRGYSDPDAAFNGISYNMIAEVIQWDIGELHHFVINSQYVLGANKKLFEFDHNAASTDHILKIYTDVPGGWSAEISASKDIIETCSWLTISNSWGSEKSLANVSLIAAANPDPEIRTAYVHVTAGKLSMIVTVIQDKNM